MKSKLFTLFTLCSAISMNVQAQTSASDIESKKMTLFNSSNHSSAPYRIPAIAVSDDHIIAISDQRPCGADVGNGQVDIYARIGTYNETDKVWEWTAEDDNDDIINYSGSDKIQIAYGSGETSSGSYGYGDAAVVVDRENPDMAMMLCVYAVKGTTYASGTASNGDNYTCARFLSTDGGYTWSEQSKLGTAIRSTLGIGNATFFFASGRILQSNIVKNGDYYRLYAALLANGSGNFVMYSDDFGATWYRLGDATSPCPDGDEAKVEELPNGNILISSRTAGGRFFNIFSYSDETYTEGSWGSAESKTDFANWSSGWFTKSSNSTNGELMIYKDVTNVSTGEKATIILQSLPTGSSRSNVSVFYKDITNSTDYDAVSDFTSGWTKGIEVDNGASAYSTMAILPNSEIGFLYEDNYDTSKAAGDYSDIVFVPITVNEITGGAYTYTAETEDVKETVATPVFSVAGGEVEANTTVEITCATEGATIYYTIDGTEPTSASTAYTGAIAITEAMTINAIAMKEGCNDSEVATATYTVKTPTEEGGGEAGGGETGGGETEEGGDTGSEDTTTPEVGTTVQWPMWVMTASDCTGSCSNSSYATLYLPCAVKLPSNVIAFYGTLNEAKTELTIYKITSGIVPKNCAVILEDMDARASITLEVVADSEAPALENTNDLKGTTEALDISGDNHDSYYIFGHGTTHFGFYLNADNTIPAGKAYLDLTTVETKARSIIITRGDAEGTTAIGTLSTVDDDTSAPEYYTLQGVKVDAPTRGIYIMKHHGQTRKVVVK